MHLDSDVERQTSYLAVQILCTVEFNETSQKSSYEEGNSSRCQEQQGREKKHNLSGG